jgi:hypothetical protein
MIGRPLGSLALGLGLAFVSGVALAREGAPAPEPAPSPVPEQHSAPAAPDAPAPHIKFDALDVNLGDVVHGEDAVATFTYHNTGNALLHILSAKPG